MARADGSGNEMWSQGYIQDLLKTASDIAGNAVRFVVGSIDLITTGGLFEANQDPVLRSSYAWTTPPSPGKLTVAISQPNTTDAAGLNWAGLPFGGTSDPSPYFVMRARNDNLDETAMIFLHELGHSLGFGHDDSVGGMSADSYFGQQGGRSLLTSFAGWLSGQPADPPQSYWDQMNAG